MTIKIAIIDDHPLLIRGLVSLLQQHPDMEVAGTYLNSAGLMQGLRRHLPDVLLFDTTMRDLDAISLVQNLKKKYTELRFIAFTNMDHEYYIRALLDSGVNGYILRNSDEPSLISAIRIVYEGRQFIDKGIVDAVRKIKRSRKQRSILTRREKEVLGLIAKAYNSAEIARMLSLSKRTVDNHRYKLLSKLKVDNSVGLINKATALGLIN